MDRSDAIPFPGAGPDQLERTLAEVDGAIELVVRGEARSVYLTSLPRLEQAAPIGAARAQRAGVLFRLEGDPATSLTAVVGPLRAGVVTEDA
jgi:hypothetical protein